MAVPEFNPNNTLAGKNLDLSPKEAIALAKSICAAVISTTPADEHRGSIWPGNITWDGEYAALGPVQSSDIRKMPSDALEFVAPEQFWNGESSSSSDVYSIGLLLYTVLNRGVMPYFEEGAARTPEMRATALQKRMNGSPAEYPKTACRQLGDVVLKAVAFSASERYRSVKDLKDALDALPETAAVPAVAPVIRLTDEEVKGTRNYRVDKTFEPIEPDKGKKKRQKKSADAVDDNMDAKEFRTPKKRRSIIPFIVILIAIAAILFVLKSCSQQVQEPQVPDPTPKPSSNVTTVIPVSDATPEETPKPTPAPTEAPVNYTYEIYAENVTWKQAEARCRELGGTLASVKNDAQLKEIIKLAEAKGLQFVWLGSYRGDNGHWYNVTGELMTYELWDINEPSVKDSDGTPEDYLLLWYRAATGEWCYNDMRNDPISILPNTYKWKIGYVCRFEEKAE